MQWELLAIGVLCKMDPPVFTEGPEMNVPVFSELWKPVTIQSYAGDSEHRRNEGALASNETD
jgi:hypothetical protein